ncbi:fermitin family homolog 3-like, partial [Chroicocephalus ridibundus]|uniref:fermitin family homolog 3-like n=1 Tax=Chroicocephalus ridibundus TaxID=1192867 RepID=UPI002FDCFD9B
MSEIQLRCRDRKGKGKQLVPRILEALHRLGALSAAEARLRFLEAWRALPGFGLAYFVVRFKGGRRDELLALGPSRLLRMDPASGAVTRVWRYSGLRQWNVNWDSQQVLGALGGTGRGWGDWEWTGRHWERTGRGWEGLGGTGRDWEWSRRGMG